MLIEIEMSLEKTTVDLTDGYVKVGGDETDDILIPGLPPSLLQLTIEGDVMQVVATERLRVSGALFPEGIPRRVLEGERIELSADIFLTRLSDEKRRDSRKLMGTAFVARELLSSGEVPVNATRAASFTCVTGLDEGCIFAVAFQENTVGRADDAHIRIRDRAVSRHHALVTRHGAHVGIVPLGSLNGVFLNGVRLRQETLLKQGDIVELGHTVLRFEAAESSPDEKTVMELTPAPASSPPETPTESVPDDSVTEPIPKQKPSEIREQVKSVLMVTIPVLSVLGASCAIWFIR
jgi:FHA domain